MPSKPSIGQVNRNGHVGNFDAYKSRRLTMDEIIAQARASRTVSKLPPAKESTDIMQFDGFTLVRYRIGSNELRTAMDGFEGGRSYSLIDSQDSRALFGVIDPEGVVRIAMDVIDDNDDGGPKISFIFTDKDNKIPPSVMLAALREIDVPASWRAGADGQLREMYDLEWDKNSGTWESVAPVHLVNVTYHRFCFSTSPSLEESVSVMILPVPEHDLASKDADKAYWARDYYRNAGFEDLHELVNERQPRPGFSSWMPKDDPILVKVTGDALDTEIARLRERAEPQEATGPRF